MATMTVTFFKTTEAGQVELGRVTFDGQAITTSGPDALERVLFDGVDRRNVGAVQNAMRNAPMRFDGAYIRASFSE